MTQNLCPKTSTQVFTEVKTENRFPIGLLIFLQLQVLPSSGPQINKICKLRGLKRLLDFSDLEFYKCFYCLWTQVHAKDNKRLSCLTLG